VPVTSCSLAIYYECFKEGAASILYPEVRDNIFFRESGNKLFFYVVSPFLRVDY
jgi:hypothetical protein